MPIDEKIELIAGDENPIVIQLYDDDGETVINEGEGLGDPDQSATGNVVMRLKRTDSETNNKKYDTSGSTISITGTGSDGKVTLFPSWGTGADNIGELTDFDSEQKEFSVGIEYKPVTLSDTTKNGKWIKVPGNRYISMVVKPRISDP